MADEDPTLAALVMDRGVPLGNSVGIDGRRALHVKIRNKLTEPLPVAVVPAQPENFTVYNEVLAVPTSSETTILTYTVPADTESILKKIFTNADVIAEYRVKLNGTTFAKKFSYYTQYYCDFDFSDGLNFDAGDVITVTAINNRPQAGDFNATAVLIDVSTL